MKVFCQQCLFIRQLGYCNLGVPLVGEPSNVVCDCPENIITETFDTWFQNVKDMKHKQNPCEINKNNNCKWYKPIKIPEGSCVGTKALKNIKGEPK